MAFSFKTAPTWQKGLVVVGGSAAAWLGYTYWKNRSGSTSSSTPSPTPSPSAGFAPLSEVGQMQQPSGFSTAWQTNVNAQLAQSNKEEQLLAQMIAALRKQLAQKNKQNKPPTKGGKPPAKTTPPPLQAPPKGKQQEGSGKGGSSKTPVPSRNAASVIARK